MAAKQKNGNGHSKQAEALLKLLRHDDQSFDRVSALLNVSKDNIADLAEYLSKLGYDVRSYSQEGVDWLTLAREEENALETLPISLTNRKIKLAIISEPRIGAYTSQISMLHWLYREDFERDNIDFVVVAGGLTVGKPTPMLQPDIFKGNAKYPRVLTDYVVEHFPRSKNFKTYIISNRRELIYKTKDGVNLLNLIANQRDDLAVAGDLEKTFDVRGVRIKVMAPWDDNSPKGLSYGMQKIVDGLSDNPAPHIVVIGGMHSRCELVDYGESGAYVYSVPSLHGQMRRQQRKGIRPRLGCLILELEFQKDWSFDMNTGFKAHFINLDNYAIENDCFKNVDALAPKRLSRRSREVLRWFVTERVISEGELSRRLNKSKQFVRSLVSGLEKRAQISIPFSAASKRYEFQQIEKEQFKPLPLRYEDIFRLLTKEAGGACTHLGSEHDLPQVLAQALKDAADARVRRIFIAGDVTEGPGATGYRGHQNDVRFADSDGLEDYAVSKWPHVKIKNDPKRPLMKTEMVVNEKGQPTYREILVKEVETLLQTDIIDGNHDCWAKSAIGHRPVRTLALRMPELLRYLGPNDGKISMDGAVMFEGVYNRLTHGDGGLGYTLSVKLQKHIASHRRRGVSKGVPTVLWFGNWHTNFLLFEDELGILLACFKSEDEFHLRKDLVSWVGLNIVELYADKDNHLTRVVSDYRNYRSLAMMNK